MKRLTWSAVLGLVAGLSFFVAGCGPDKSREDANDVVTVCPPNSTVASGCIDKGRPHVMSFNNHYPDVETKCDGAGHRIFVTTDEHGNGVMIWPDPTCPGFVQGQEPNIAVVR